MVIDDFAGGWTNRAATDHGLRVGYTPGSKRFWVVVPLWSSEPASLETARIALRTAIARTAWQTRQGRPNALQNVLEQEGAALAWAGATEPSLDAEDLAYSRVVLESLGEFRTALLGDAPAHEDVHEVRLDVAEDARVVGDEEDAEARLRVRAVDALGHDLERVDVETRVGLVEDREPRAEEPTDTANA